MWKGSALLVWMPLLFLSVLLGRLMKIAGVQQMSMLSQCVIRSAKASSVDMPSVMYISKEGDLLCLADDFVDKLDLGFKQVERVSNIEFDHQQQCWTATNLAGEVIASDPVRSKVIDMEREYFNSLLEKSFASTSSL